MPENQPERRSDRYPARCLSLVYLRYDEAAAKEAATETVTANLVTYPVITFKLHCTGTLPDGTQVEELVRLDYYIDGYDGIF